MYEYTLILAVLAIECLVCCVCSVWCYISTEKLSKRIMDAHQDAITTARPRPDEAGSVTIYKLGALSCSVCAPKGMSVEEVEAAVNRQRPCGTSLGWQVSEDTHFNNPCPCNQNPDKRVHYLMDC